MTRFQALRISAFILMVTLAGCATPAPPPPAATPPPPVRWQAPPPPPPPAAVQPPGPVVGLLCEETARQIPFAGIGICTSFANQQGFSLRFPTINSALQSPGPNPAPQSRNANSLLIEDTVTWLRGSHNISMGGSYTQYQTSGR